MTTLCGLYPSHLTLTEKVASAITERLSVFLETGEINWSPIIEGPRDPFLEFWSVYGGDIEEDIILEEDVEFCLEWLGKSDGFCSSSEEKQG